MRNDEDNLDTAWDDTGFDLDNAAWLERELVKAILNSSLRSLSRVLMDVDDLILIPGDDNAEIRGLGSKMHDQLGSLCKEIADHLSDIS